MCSSVFLYILMLLNILGACEFPIAHVFFVCISEERAAEAKASILEYLLRHALIFWKKEKENKKTQRHYPILSLSPPYSPSFAPFSLSVSLTKAAVSSKMRPRSEGMQMKSLLVD